MIHPNRTYVTLLLLALLALTALPGCSLIITDSSVATLEPGAPGQPVESLETAEPPAATVTPDTRPADGEPIPIQVEHVQILTGWASPIPALVEVSGTWPDLCAQLAGMDRPVVHDFRIEITLLATAPDPNCPPDRVGLPFAIRIPLNWMQLPAGVYTVDVNGVETALNMPIVPAELEPESAPELGAPATPTPGPAPDQADAVFPAVADPQPEPVPVTVQHVAVDVGLGSPIPVNVQIVTELPSLCAQLATVTQAVEPFRFDISVLAHPGRPDCPPDTMGIGLTLWIPLNVVELPEGAYTVSANGVETTFSVPVTPGVEAMDATQLIAALGATPGDSLDDPLFNARAQWIELDDAMIQVYEFEDAAVAVAAAGTVSGGGTIIGTTTVDWIETPHFYRSGRLLALYAGNDQAVLDALETNLGVPFLVGVTMTGEQ